MKKLLALLLVVLMVVPALAMAEEPAISGDVRVTYWGGESRIAKTTQVAEMFMEQYPDVNVILEHSSDYWTQLDTQLAAGGAPDVLQFGGNFPDYVANGFLAPITSYLGTVIETENFDQSMIDDITVDGEVYGMCLGANRVGTLFNKSLLESVGAPLPDETLTWANLGDYLAEVKAVLPDGVYPIFDASVYETSYLSYYAGCMGESLWTGSEVTMTEDTVKSWMQMWADFRAAGYCPPGEISAEYGEDSADNSALITGEIAMIFLYSNMAVGYQAATTDTLGMTCLPDREAHANAMLPSQFFCINQASENKDAAAAFINFFVNNTDAGMVLGNDRGIPCNSEVRAAISATATPIDQEVYKLFDITSDYSKVRDPNSPNDQAVVDSWQAINFEVAYGQKSVDDAAAEFYADYLELVTK